MNINASSDYYQYLLSGYIIFVNGKQYMRTIETTNHVRYIVEI